MQEHNILLHLGLLHFSLKHCVIFIFQVLCLSTGELVVDLLRNQDRFLNFWQGEVGGQWIELSLEHVRFEMPPAGSPGGKLGRQSQVWIWELNEGSRGLGSM